MTRRSLLTLDVLGFSFLAWPAFAQVPAGGEFRVNTQTAYDQLQGSVAIAPPGDFVVVWTARTTSIWDVFGQRYDAAGTPVGGEFQVNVFTTHIQSRPAVAMDAQGHSVVAWLCNGRDDIMAQRFDSAGIRIGSEFPVGSDDATGARIAADATGNFVVAWGDLETTTDYNVFVRRVTADGSVLGSPQRVNTTIPGPQNYAVVARAPDGAFLVVWAFPEVHARLFDAGGAAVGNEFRVNTTTSGVQTAVAVAADGDGRFIVAWDGPGDGFSDGIFAQRIAPSGAFIGAEFLVNTYTTGTQRQPVVGAAEAGSFVISWYSTETDGSLAAVVAQRFDAAGARRGPEWVVNTYTTNSQNPTSIAVDQAGNFTLVWDSDDQDGHQRGVYAQRYGGLVPTAVRVVDGDNGVLEPGESSSVRPSWRNVNGAAQTFTGALSRPTGPAGAVPVIDVASASYGTVPNGTTAECSPCYAVTIPAASPRPATHWDGGVTETIVPDVQGQQKRWALHVGDSFTDVPRASGFYRFVETLLHRGVTGGCAATAYCPGAGVTREQMAVFVLVAKEGAGYAPAACATPIFADVPASSGFCPWIEELARRGVVGGCGGGFFCPAVVVPRDQMAVFTLRTPDPTFIPPPCGATPMFPDVPPSSPFCRWVEELARRGIASGCGGGNYCPAAGVTREQMSVFISLTFGLTLYGP